MDNIQSDLLSSLTLSTTPDEIYCALIEATASGIRLTVESFTEQGVN